MNGSDHIAAGGKPVAAPPGERDGHKDPARRFFGRRKGPSLSARQQSLLAGVGRRIGIGVSSGEYPGALDPRDLFAGLEGGADIWFEIGFGKGEHLAWQAARNPDVGLIGCEPYLNGYVGLLDKIQDKGLGNVRAYADDARHLLWRFPDACLARVFLLHPDPWPKNRHAARRFVRPDNLDLLARVMADGAELRIGTDHPVYRRWTSVHMAAHPDFEWLAEGPDDWRTRPVDWPETRYEVKALEGGATYFRYRRRCRRCAAATPTPANMAKTI